MPLLALLLIFIVLPLAELYVIFKVGEAIGVPLTILLLAADSIIGWLLLKSQGRAVWRRFSETMAAGRIPHREVLDGVMVIFGGAFLITPGFITDVIGLFLLLPPTRALTRGLVVRAFKGRLVLGMAGAVTRRRPRAEYDVEGTATPVDEEFGPPTPRLPR